MVDDVLHPGEGGVARWRCAVLPALVVTEELAAPVAHVEGRVGEDIVGLEIGVAVVVEGVFCEVRRLVLLSRSRLGTLFEGVIHLLKPPLRVGLKATGEQRD